MIKTGEPCTKGTAYYANCLFQLGECTIRCETGICEDGICVCNPSNGYPCDEETEACIDSNCQISPCRQSPYKEMQPQVSTLQMNVTRVNKMYDCCLEGGDVTLQRTWEGSVTNREDTIQVCPGKSASKTETTYIFTREDGTPIDITRAEDTGEPCSVTGKAMQSSIWGACFRNDHCTTGFCNFGPGGRSSVGQCL